MRMLIPPITLMVWKYDLELLIRALKDYEPKSDREEENRTFLLEYLDTVERD